MSSFLFAVSVLLLSFLFLGFQPLSSAGSASSTQLAPSTTASADCNPCKEVCSNYNFSTYIDRYFSVQDSFNRSYYLSPCNNPKPCPAGYLDCQVSTDGSVQPLGLGPVDWTLTAANASSDILSTKLLCGRSIWMSEMLLFCDKGDDTLTLRPVVQYQCVFYFQLDSSAVCTAINATQKLDLQQQQQQQLPTPVADKSAKRNGLSKLFAQSN